MIDHIGFPVSDYARAKAFYLKALAPLDYSLVMEVTQEETGHDPAAGFGANGKPDFWIGGEGGLDKPLHVAILAKDRASVDAFYKAAIAAGGRDNGAPGIRAHYHANYYGAFVLDPDGHNIDTVCHKPECIRFRYLQARRFEQGTTQLARRCSVLDPRPVAPITLSRPITPGNHMNFEALV
jgi:catechol 2,3-dioxygenase-like lactoylglutathione lyase family enzyme